MLSSLLQDFRYALRLLARSPGFTLVALGSLAIGIGANTAIFSLVNGVLLRPMPVEQADRLVSVFQTDERNPGNLPLSHLNFRDLREANTTLSGLSAVSFGQANFRLDNQSSQVFIQIVSGNYFDVMGVTLADGRPFRPEEDEVEGAFPVAIVSWPFWQNELGGRTNVIGTEIMLNRHPFTVVGVAPRGFTGTFPVGTPGVWVPMAMHAVVQPEIAWYGERRGLFMFPVGRLRPGVTVEQATANLQTIMARLAEEYPVENEGRSAGAAPLLETRINPTGNGILVALSRLLLGTVGIVLLIACANLASLLLARATGRRREISVRLAIGANRRRLVRQLLTESLTLSLLGGLSGLLVANWLLRVLVTSPNLFPFPIEDSLVALDGRVLAFTAIVSVATGVLFGLFPALEASRTNVSAAIKQDAMPGEGRGWLRKSLVAAQVTMSVVSLVAAGLFLRSTQHTFGIDPGFEPANVTTAAFNLGREGYDADRGRLFYRQLVERASSLPGVASAAVAESIPLAGVQIQRTVFLTPAGAAAASEADRRLAFVNYVSPAYFATTGIPLVRGRAFDGRDTVGAPSVAIVNETMARQLWPGDDAIGKRFWFFGETDPTEVVGVASDSKVGFLGESPVSLVYEPIEQDYRTFASLLVRTAGPTTGTAALIRGAVADIDADLTIVNVVTLDEQIRASMTGQQTLSGIVGILGGIALLLATMGLYGVASHWVSYRTREIGVRMALGAEPGRMVRLVVKQSMAVVTAGVLAGLVLTGLAAVLLGPQISTLLVEVSPADPVTFAGAVALLLAVGVLACLVPARRAARIDPLRALRQD